MPNSLHVEGTGQLMVDCSLYHVCSVFCIDFYYIGRIQGGWAGLGYLVCYLLLNLL